MDIFDIIHYMSVHGGGGKEGGIFVIEEISEAGKPVGEFVADSVILFSIIGALLQIQPSH